MPHRRISDAGRLQRIRHDIARVSLERHLAVDEHNHLRIAECDRLLDALREEEKRAVTAQAWPLPDYRDRRRH